MSGPLDGIRVLEVAMYGFVPSAGAVLSDWGADVVKVEHSVTGDPQRGLRQIGPHRVDGDPNPNIEHANRGKRSIGVDMSHSDGQKLIYELTEGVDVFLTSFLPSARRRLGIDVEHIRAANPSVIYARGSGLGPRGDEADKGGYDLTAFWCRGSVAATVTPPELEGMINPPGPAFGDTISGTNLAGGIAAALLKRERTGETSIVDVSLLSSGLWSMGHTIALSAHVGEALQAPPAGAHGAPTNPLVGLYATSDGRYLSFVMLQPTKFWPDVCHHIGRPDLATDPRFETVEAIAAHTADAVAILREEIAKRTLAEWTTALTTLTGPWAPVQDALQVLDDPQVRANEYIGPAGDLQLVSSPVQFDITAPRLRPGPEFAAHTDEVLLELGLHWDRIIALKAAGAIT